MDYDKLLGLKERIASVNIDKESSAVQSFYKSFEIEYTHNSTAIEGNTLSLIETKTVLEDGISVGGKSLREIYEVVNHSKAFAYIQKSVAERKPLDEHIVKDIHSLLMENIMVGGIYRNVPVRITGASHKPPVPSEMYLQIKDFYRSLPEKETLTPIELAAYTHAEFVRIHPFEDGNGRTSRLIMNYQLMAHGYLPVSIAKENRLNYYETLDVYASSGKLQPFTEMIAELEENQLQDFLSMLPPEPEHSCDYER